MRQSNAHFFHTQLNTANFGVAQPYTKYGNSSEWEKPNEMLASEAKAGLKEMDQVYGAKKGTRLERAIARAKEVASNSGKYAEDAGKYVRKNWKPLVAGAVGLAGAGAAAYNARRARKGGFLANAGKAAGDAFNDISRNKLVRKYGPAAGLGAAGLLGAGALLNRGD